MTESELAALRRQKDAMFKQGYDSPLTEEQQETFDGLRYYPFDPSLEMTVQVEPVETDRQITIQTTTGDTRTYTRYARFTFAVDGQPVTLTIYDSPHGYFLPFVDANAGSETYPAGRYLEPEELANGRFYVNFNLAYNPLCAYNDGWNCPITPAENRVSVAIRAGEMNPVGEWVEDE